MEHVVDESVGSTAPLDLGAGHLTGLTSGIVDRGPDGSRAARRTTPVASEVAPCARWRRQKAGTFGDDGGVESRVGASPGRRDLVRVAVSANFARDHLDFHSSLEAYFVSAKKLFGSERCHAGTELDALNYWFTRCG